MRAYKVNVDVVQIATRNPEGLERCSDVLIDLGCLALDAGSGKTHTCLLRSWHTNLEAMSLLEVVPHKFGSYEPS